MPTGQDSARTRQYVEDESDVVVFEKGREGGPFAAKSKLSKRCAGNDVGWPFSAKEPGEEIIRAAGVIVEWRQFFIAFDIVSLCRDLSSFGRCFAPRSHRCVLTERVFEIGQNTSRARQARLQIPEQPAVILVGNLVTQLLYTCNSTDEHQRLLAAKYPTP